MPAFRQEEEGKDPDRFQISHRDRELLMLIAGAYNNKIIAASLDIALRTVYQRIEESASWSRSRTASNWPSGSYSRKRIPLYRGAG